MIGKMVPIMGYSWLPDNSALQIEPILCGHIVYSHGSKLALSKVEWEGKK